MLTGLPGLLASLQIFPSLLAGHPVPQAGLPYPMAGLQKLLLAFQGHLASFQALRIVSQAV